VTEARRRIDPRLVLLVAFVAAAIWAATALARGPQPASGDAGAGNGPANVLVQDQGGGGAQPPSSGDCPDRGGSRGNDGSGGGAPDV
jgi:hypothetical protein